MAYLKIVESMGQDAINFDSVDNAVDDLDGISLQIFDIYDSSRFFLMSRKYLSKSFYRAGRSYIHDLGTMVIILVGLYCLNLLEVVIDMLRKYISLAFYLKKG